MTSLSVDQKLHRVYALQPAEMLAAPVAMAAASFFWIGADALGSEGRMALTILSLAVIGWTMTRLPDSLVAMAAALALVLTGTLREEQLFAALGRDLVWLLVAAFVIASVLKSSGLMEHLVARALVPFRGFASLACALTLLITSTAFFIPSTSGRAALLLPVFMALAAQMPDARLIRPLGLLFPTIILLSAGGSLLGAGAHLIAVDTIAGSGGPVLGYVDWIMLGLPVSLLSSFLATGLILWLFVPASLRHARIALKQPDSPLNPRQKRLAMALAALLILWMTTGLHDISIVIVSLGGALALLSRPFVERKTKEIFRDVDVELLLYLTATTVLADAVMVTGADRWLADGMLAVLPEALARNRVVAVSFMTLVAVLCHLVITSRSARAAVLIPAVALPVAAFGHDPVLIVMVAVLGTGFCQTMMASAKPVAIYGALDLPTFSQRDLFRLAAPLVPAVAAPLVAAALVFWPAQLDLDPSSVDVGRAAEARSETVATIDLPAVSPRPVIRPAQQAAPFEGSQTAQTRRSGTPTHALSQLETDLNVAVRGVRRMVHALGRDLGLR